MPLTDSPDSLVQWHDAARFGIFQPAADCSDGFKLVYTIEQRLIRVRILYHDFRLSFDSEHDWPAALLHPFHENCCVALEIRERMNVFGEVNHCSVSHEISI